MFRKQYADVFSGDERWQTLDVPTGDRFAWEPDSTYVRNPPFFEGMTMQPAPLTRYRRRPGAGGARRQHHHRSHFAGGIDQEGQPGREVSDGARRAAGRTSTRTARAAGNHEVMMRGTFANTRLRNQLAPGTEGGWTTYQPDGDVMTIYDAAMQYKAAGVPLIVLAGKEYGSGSSRDWAAKGTLLLGVKAVIAESFERIHRSNLVNMGVLPLQFQAGASAASLGLTGREAIRADRDCRGTAAGRSRSPCVRSATPKAIEFQAVARIDTPEELVAFRHGGILPYVVRQLVGKKSKSMKLDSTKSKSGVQLPSGELRLSLIETSSSSMLTTTAIKARAASSGSMRAASRRPTDLPELPFFREWLDRGYAGDMSYLARSAERRADVRQVLPSAKTVIVTATNYNTDRPYSTESRDAGRAHIARYAWGDDYHEVILAAAWSRCSRGCAARPTSRSRRGRMSTPVRFKSVCTRGTPGLDGSARTRA